MPTTTTESGLVSTVPPPPRVDALGGSNRLTQLLTQMDRLLAGRYAFDVFARDSINLGIMVTYRQTWVPHQYQVGELVSTIPLAPKEIRRYTTRTVTKKTRARKELEDNLQTRRTESSDLTRIDGEIVEKAKEQTHFNLTANETFGGDGFSIAATQNAGGNQSEESARTKKEIRESVLKSAHEYRQQHRVEVDTSDSFEAEATTFHEIQNPNDELAVTYLLYELQRTYRISERIHKLTPVILVANEVPAPNEIDDAWLVRHDWILRRAILDDSFRPALEYLTTSFVGAEINIRILESNATAQKQVVDRLHQQIRTQMGILDDDQDAVLEAVRQLGASEKEQGVVDFFKRLADPLGLTGKTDTGAVDAAQAMVDHRRETLDRAERERARLLAQFEVATTALQRAVDKLSTSVKEHYDRVAEIDRLRVHVKENILYYMQAIWREEPPDQRFFRLYNIDVPLAVPDTAGVTLDVTAPVNLADHYGIDFDDFAGKDTRSVALPMPPPKIVRKKLVEIADLDTVLAYKGNYMVFPLKESNYVTTHMMASYLEVGDRLTLRDPDGLESYTVEELQALATCFKRNAPERYQLYKEDFKRLLIDRLTSSRKDNDLVIVPTSSLYIECLVGTHPLLEDFKLIHRALDVKKVQAEVRHAELENIRLAARAVEGDRSDPDIEKMIVVDGSPALVMDTE